MGADEGRQALGVARGWLRIGMVSAVAEPESAAGKARLMNGVNEGCEHRRDDDRESLRA